MAGRLCKIEQTPLSWHRMVSMGVHILAAYLMFLRGFADCAWHQCHTWLRTKSSLIKGVAVRRTRLPTDAVPSAPFSSTAMQT